MGKRLFDEVTTPDEAQGWVVSASQIKRWRECPRAWGFEYLKGLRPPPSKAAALGSAVHRLLELHFKGEPWPTHETDGFGDRSAAAEKLARAVIDSGVLPSPGFFIEPENVERSFMLRTGPIQIRGFIDLIVPRARPPLVADHKTSSDPAKYGLTAETLGDDIQATIYAAAVLDMLGVDEVACQWTYCKTRGRAEVHPVRANLDRERIRKNLNRYVLPPTREILDTVARHEADEVDPIDLRPVPESCGNWGGCAHSDYCPRSRDQLLTASGWNETETENTEQKENETMSLIEMLKAKKAAQAATPAPTEAPTPAPTEAAVAASVAPVAPEPAPEPKPPKAKKLAPPRINSPEHDSEEGAEAPAPVEVTPEAPEDKPPTLNRAGMIEALKDRDTLELTKSRKKATTARPFALKRDLDRLIADKILIEIIDKGDHRLAIGSIQGAAPEAPAEVAPMEAHDAVVEVTFDPTPTEAPAGPAPVTAAPTPPEEAPLGRRLVALYMRKDGRIIVEIDPAGIPE